MLNINLPLPSVSVSKTTGDDVADNTSTCPSSDVTSFKCEKVGDDAISVISLADGRSL